MIRNKVSAVGILVLCVATLHAQESNDTQLLQTRETVWRAWFDGDIASLQQLVPAETIVISSGEKEWKHQNEVFATSAAFHKEGGKLVRLEFPRTEVQHFGDVAIIWSSYLVETESAGKRSTTTGRVTEVFHWKDGHWTNPGWHTDDFK